MNEIDNFDVEEFLAESDDTAAKLGEKPVSERIFAAIPVPDEIVRKVSRTFSAYPQHIKEPISPEKWHMTVLWLGDVENPKQYWSRLNKPMPQAYSPTIRINYVGRGEQRDQMWAYVEPSNVLDGLRSEVRSRLRKIRFPVPQESMGNVFIPHIAVAKLHQSMGGVGFSDTPISASFTAHELIIYRSELTPQGSVYHPQVTIPL